MSDWFPQTEAMYLPFLYRMSCPFLCLSLPHVYPPSIICQLSNGHFATTFHTAQNILFSISTTFRTFMNQCDHYQLKSAKVTRFFSGFKSFTAGISFRQDLLTDHLRAEISIFSWSTPPSKD